MCGRDDVQGVVGAEFAAGTLKVKGVYVIHDKTTVLKAIEAATRGGTAPSREEVSAAVRQVRRQGITGDIEFDAKGDRKRALYFVLEVASESPEQWRENKIVRQLTIGPPGKH